MSAVILFRRSRLNHNSFASIVGAMARDGRTDGWRVILQNHTRTLPRNTRIIVYSFSTPELAGLISEVDSLKNRAGGALVVAGGPHPSADPEGTLKAGFDFVFVGEGEETFPEFICAAAKGEPGPPPPEPLEPLVVPALKKMGSSGRLDGDWETQAACGRDVLRWREEGKILV